MLVKIKEGKVIKEKVKLGDKTAKGIEILSGLNDLEYEFNIFSSTL
jgi:hypothetical protein